MTEVALPDGMLTMNPPRLRGGYSPSSGHHHFPLQEQCPYTGASDVEPVELSDHGTVWGYTEVRTAPPGYAGPVPYCFGIVELPEGLRLVTRLGGRFEDLAHGIAVRLRTVELPNADGGTLAVWEFAPDGAP